MPRTTSRPRLRQRSRAQYDSLCKRLTPDFVRLVEEGHPFAVICDFLGLPYPTFWHWMNNGTSYLDLGAKHDPESKQNKDHKVFAEFVLGCRKALATYKMRVHKRLHLEDAPEEWRRDMTILERRERDTWAKDDPMGGTQDSYDPDERFL